MIIQNYRSEYNWQKLEDFDVYIFYLKETVNQENIEKSKWLKPFQNSANQQRTIWIIAFLSVVRSRGMSVQNSTYCRSENNWQKFEDFDVYIFHLKETVAKEKLEK